MWNFIWSTWTVQRKQLSTKIYFGKRFLKVILYSQDWNQSGANVSAMNPLDPTKVLFKEKFHFRGRIFWTTCLKPTMIFIIKVVQTRNQRMTWWWISTSRRTHLECQTQIFMPWNTLRNIPPKIPHLKIEMFFSARVKYLYKKIF